MERHRKSSGIQLLLLEDIDGLGRKGDVGVAKPGHARNYLIPQGKALIVDAQTLRKQEQLRAEREKQAAVDRAAALQLANQLRGMTLATHVKVDQEGHMYGSVSAGDIVEILAAEGMEVERRSVRIGQPIRKVGQHEIELRLKEGVEVSFKLKVIPEGMEDLPVEAAEVVAPLEEEVPAAEPELKAESEEE